MWQLTVRRESGSSRSLKVQPSDTVRSVRKMIEKTSEKPHLLVHKTELLYPATLISSVAGLCSGSVVWWVRWKGVWVEKEGERGEWWPVWRDVTVSWLKRKIQKWKKIPIDQQVVLRYKGKDLVHNEAKLRACGVKMPAWDHDNKPLPTRHGTLQMHVIPVMDWTAQVVTDAQISFVASKIPHKSVNYLYTKYLYVSDTKLDHTAQNHGLLHRGWSRWIEKQEAGLTVQTVWEHVHKACPDGIESMYLLNMLETFEKTDVVDVPFLIKLSQYFTVNTWSFFPEHCMNLTPEEIKEELSFPNNNIYCNMNDALIIWRKKRGSNATVEHLIDVLTRAINDGIIEDTVIHGLYEPQDPITDREISLLSTHDLLNSKWRQIAKTLLNMSDEEMELVKYGENVEESISKCLSEVVVQEKMQNWKLKHRSKKAMKDGYLTHKLVMPLSTLEEDYLAGSSKVDYLISMISKATSKDWRKTLELYFGVSKEILQDCFPPEKEKSTITTHLFEEWKKKTTQNGVGHLRIELQRAGVISKGTFQSLLHNQKENENMLTHKLTERMSFLQQQLRNMYNWNQTNHLDIDFCHKGQRLNYTSFLEDAILHKSESSIIVYGERGVGKTSLCKRIAMDWKSSTGRLSNQGSNGTSLQYYKLLVMLNCEEVQGKRNISWTKPYTHDKIDHFQLIECLKFFGSQIIFLIDDCTDTFEVDVELIRNSVMFPEATVICFTDTYMPANENVYCLNGITADARATCVKNSRLKTTEEQLRRAPIFHMLSHPFFMNAVQRYECLLNVASIRKLLEEISIKLPSKKKGLEKYSVLITGETMTFECSEDCIVRKYDDAYCSHKLYDEYVYQRYSRQPIIATSDVAHVKPCQLALVCEMQKPEVCNQFISDMLTTQCKARNYANILTLLAYGSSNITQNIKSNLKYFRYEDRTTTYQMFKMFLRFCKPLASVLIDSDEGLKMMLGNFGWCNEQDLQTLLIRRCALQDWHYNIVFKHVVFEGCADAISENTMLLLDRNILESVTIKDSAIHLSLISFLNALSNCKRLLTITLHHVKFQQIQTDVDFNFTKAPKLGILKIDSNIEDQVDLFNNLFNITDCIILTSKKNIRILMMFIKNFAQTFHERKRGTQLESSPKVLYLTAPVSYKAIIMSEFLFLECISIQYMTIDHVVISKEKSTCALPIYNCYSSSHKQVAVPH